MQQHSLCNHILTRNGNYRRRFKCRLLYLSLDLFARDRNQEPIKKTCVEFVKKRKKRGKKKRKKKEECEWQNNRNFVSDNLKCNNKGRQLHSVDNTFLSIPSSYLQILYNIYDKPFWTIPEKDQHNYNEDLFV